MAPVTLFAKATVPAAAAKVGLEEVAVDGPLGGSSYRYRGATIDCEKGGHVCRLTLREHPLTGMSFGVAGTITPLIDLWLDEGRLPRYMRPSLKLGR